MADSKPTVTSKETALLLSLHVAGGRKYLPASQHHDYDRLEHARLVTTATAGVDVDVVRLTAAGRAIAEKG